MVLLFCKVCSCSLTNFSVDFRQTNCGVTLRIDRATFATWPALPKKQDHLLQSDFCTYNFRWIWLVFEGPHGGLLFCFGLKRIAAWFVSYDDLINVSWSTAIVVFQHFFRPIDMSLFWAIAGSNENKSFSACSSCCNIECMLLKEMPKAASSSR